MGYIRHDAIIVEAYPAESIHAAWVKATELGLRATEVVDAVTNGYHFFMIAPDGSKEGWETSNEYEAKRAAWIAWAEGTQMVTWVMVSFGDDAPYINRSSYGPEDE